MKRLIVGLIFLFSTSLTHAVLLTYTGNDFNSFDIVGTPPDPHTTSDSVMATLELSSVLAANLTDAVVAPLSFSFSDGVSTITDANATSSFFQFTTDGVGQITEWFVVASIFAPTSGGGFQKGISSQKDLSFPFVIDSGQDVLCGPASTSGGCAHFGAGWYSTVGQIRDTPGTWSYQTASVPEPSTLALLGAGLLGLAFRRKKAT